MNSIDMVSLSAFLIFAVVVVVMMINRIGEERGSEEHIKACTDPYYFKKDREQILEEENARLREENARLAIEINRREFR